MSDDFTMTVELRLTVHDRPALLEAFRRTELAAQLEDGVQEQLAGAPDALIACALNHLIRLPDLTEVPGVISRGASSTVRHAPQAVRLEPRPAQPGVERWRRALGHEGYFVASLRLATPAEGGWDRAVQRGYSAQWWLDVGGEHWLGHAGIDLLGDRRSIKPGETGLVRIYPAWPAYWRQVGSMSVLRLREGLGKKTLGVATVMERVNVPIDAPVRLEGGGTWPPS